ncbi:MAG: hypothetical protein K2W96_12040 [Gemmataceae bacterium]|nr:hypothetical protein [Gemmataceae bacterium]
MLPTALVTLLLATNGGEPEAVGPWREGAHVGWYPDAPRFFSLLALEAEVRNYLGGLPSWLAGHVADGEAGPWWHGDAIPFMAATDYIVQRVILHRGSRAGQVRIIDWSVEAVPEDQYGHWVEEDGPDPRTLPMFLSDLIPPIPPHVPEEESNRAENELDD